MKKVSILLAAVAVLTFAISSASAEMRYVYSKNGPQDPLDVQGEPQGWVTELGNQPPFPDDEWIESSDWETTETACSEYPYDDPGIINRMVSITNKTTKAHYDLYYVADPETSLSNYDGWMDEIPIPPSPDEDQEAFRIDSIGVNRPLVYESYAPPNDIFEPGETWWFIIQDYVNGLGLPASAFASIGVGSASAGDTCSSGSIIPEPATLALLGLGGLAVIGRRRR